MVMPSSPAPVSAVQSRVHSLLRQSLVSWERRFWSDDEVVVTYGPSEGFTLSQCLQGLKILGPDGNDLRSPAFASTSMAAIRNGWGILAVTNAPGDADRWERWAIDHGRREDLLVVRPCGFSRFDLWRYLCLRGPCSLPHAGVIGDVLSVLAAIASGASLEASASRAFSQRPGVGGRASYSSRLSRLKSFRDLLDGLDESLEVVGAPAGPCADPASSLGGGMRQPSEAARLRSLVSRLIEGPSRHLFESSDRFTFRPEQVGHGAIMVIDMPIERYGVEGRATQAVLKHLVIRAALERSGHPTTRPVAVVAPHAPEFLTPPALWYLPRHSASRVVTIYGFGHDQPFLAGWGQGIPSSTR